LRQEIELLEQLIENPYLFLPEFPDAISYFRNGFLNEDKFRTLRIEEVRETDDPLFQGYRRHLPLGKGEPLPPDAFVFGDGVGRQRRSVRTAWRLTCQRAKIVGLHFHDLRREAGSRWMDAGVPLATIQRWLGHHNISQTSTYLAASLGGDADEMRAFEERIGRVEPLQQIAISPDANGSQPTRSGFEANEQTNNDGVGLDPGSVVH